MIVKKTVLSQTTASFYSTHTCFSLQHLQSWHGMLFTENAQGIHQENEYRGWKMFVDSTE